MLTIKSQQRVYFSAFLILALLCALVLPYGWVLALLLLFVGIIGHKVAISIASADRVNEDVIDCANISSHVRFERAADSARANLPFVNLKSVRVGYADIFLDTSAIHLFGSSEQEWFERLCEYHGLAVELVPSGWRALREEITGRAAVAVGSRYLIEGMGMAHGETFVPIGPPLFVFQGHFVMVRRDYVVQTTEGYNGKAQELPRGMKARLLQGGTIAAEMQSDLFAAAVQAGKTVGVTVEPRHLETSQGLKEFIAGNVQLYCGGLLQTAALLQSHSETCEVLFRPAEIQLSSWNYLYARTGTDALQLEALRGSLLQIHRYALERLFLVYLMQREELDEDEPGVVERYSQAIKSLPGGGEWIKSVEELLAMAFETPYDLLLGSDMQAKEVQAEFEGRGKYLHAWDNRDKLGIGNVSVSANGQSKPAV